MVLYDEGVGRGDEGHFSCAARARADWRLMRRFRSSDDKEFVSGSALQIQRRVETLARFGGPTGGELALTEVALVVTIGEPGCDFPYVGLADRLTAQHTEGLWARCPAIDQNELHGVTLNLRARANPGTCWPNQLIDQFTADAKSTRPK
jgi:hypothetical protein